MHKDQQVLDAIRTVRKYLQSEFIVERCKDNRTFGCASCDAMAVDEKLGALMRHITHEENTVFNAPA